MRATISRVRTAVVVLVVSGWAAAAAAQIAAPEALSEPAGPAARVASAVLSAEDAAFLDEVQRRTFDFFWETTNPSNGLARDRWPRESPCSVAALGFALSAYCVGVERDWVDRRSAAERVATTLRFLWSAPQHDGPTGASGHRGFFYHFLDMESGGRYRKCELSSIDTALLMCGVLMCKEYFAEEDEVEAEIRGLADKLYRRVEWDWMQPRAPLMGMGWRPEGGFLGVDYQGYNEAMMLYLLAMGSPTHPIDPSAWEAFHSTNQWADSYGYQHVNFSPLFGHQYSHVWIDFRGLVDPYLRDKGIDYFENSRRATLAQRSYAIENPMGWRGHGANVWGFTACDGPTNGLHEIGGVPRRLHSYFARGASGVHVADDGTISPTAAGGSLVFAPEVAIPALREMKRLYGDHLYGRYGYFDSFNPSIVDAGIPLIHGRIVPGVGWFDTDYLGIDQGPILLMAENLRTELVWRLMRQNPALRAGLYRAGFEGGWLGDHDADPLAPSGAKAAAVADENSDLIKPAA